ncbi:MAG TPA: hypothetical protein VIK59_00230 [Verrucomicrobiae bacterium]
MKRDDVLAKIFEAEFCEPKEKAQKERDLQDSFKAASKQTNTAIYILQPAFLKVYPQYRAKRLGKEFPELPFKLRGN